MTLITLFGFLGLWGCWVVGVGGCCGVWAAPLEFRPCEGGQRQWCGDEFLSDIIRALEHGFCSRSYLIPRGEQERHNGRSCGFLEGRRSQNAGRFPRQGE